MYNGKLNLTNPSGAPLAISNDFKDTYLFKEAVMDCETPEDLRATAQSFCSYGYRMRVDKDLPKYTRLVYTASFGNTHYLIAYKDQSISSNRLSGFSDEELIAELERRGYQI